MEKSYVVYCDESDRKGKHYSYFFGMIAFETENYSQIENFLFNCKTDINNNPYRGELKWSKISNSAQDEFIYKKFIDGIFDCLQSGKILIRIFCCDNIYMESSFNDEILSFHKLYYTSLVGNFKYFNINRVHFDRLPYQNKEKIKEFKELIATGLNVKADNLIEVDSSKHSFSQAIDVILGAMSFRLNDKHKHKEKNQKQRGKKTIAKERMYKYIINKIRILTPAEYYKYFDIKRNTPVYDNLRQSRLTSDKYRHWIHISSSQIDKYYGDKKKAISSNLSSKLANRTSET
jgi:hypothetical protein